MKVHTQRNVILPVAITSILATAVFFLSQNTSADESPKSDAKEMEVATSENDQLTTKLSNEGFAAMRAVHSARLAIFNGESEKAKQLVEEAESQLKQAKADAATFESESGSGISTSDVWIPIDGEIGLTDTFVMSPEKAKAVDEANKHIGASDKESAIDVLRLANIDVRFTREMLPLDQTERHVYEAKDLLSEEKYYEANLAMKAAEDAIVMDTIELLGSTEAQ